MSRPIAVLVEDDPQQAEVSRAVLETADFTVRSFDAIGPVRDYLQDTTDELIDLFVLDRRLPMNSEEPASNEFGDEFLEEVRGQYPDARLIVFTGYATIRHVQNSLQGGGQLPCLNADPIDRVTVLEKDQSLEFKDHVKQFRELLQRLDDVEIIAPPDSSPLGGRDRRALRRLAFEYGAASISVHALDGGLTGASVWRCQIDRTEGRIATVVAKRVTSPWTPGGLPELLSHSTTTATLRTVSGLMAGNHLNVLQLAGESPVALMKLIAEQPDEAVRLAQPVWTSLSSVASQKSTLTVEDLCESLIGWQSLSGLLAPFGVQTPAGSLLVTAMVGPRHGDLHPGNVLIDSDHAVLIDFDSETFAAGLLDPVVMLISTLVHPASPIAGEGWPDISEIDARLGTPDFGQGHASEPWFRAVNGWIEECRTSEREFWALVLAYAGRQLRYDDVLQDSETLVRVIALAGRAATALTES